MNNIGNKVLLPDGLRDVLPPDADHEASVAQRLVAAFAGRGYQRVDPPLVEFEDTLLDGAGHAMSTATFRLMDPVSHRMMGVRSDMTIQVARIAATRLAQAPRPLRLAYAGNVLRVKGTQIRPERQFIQAGVEIIGSEAASADAEIIILAVEALGEAGISNLSVDINMPTLVPALCRAMDLQGETETAMRAALDRKDAAAVAAAGGKAADLFGALLRASGSARAALAALSKIDLPEECAAERQRLDEVVSLLKTEMPALSLTIDAVEYRGFEYQTGLSFTVFARGVRGELGRGGRYHVSQNGEPATGFTLFLNSVLRALPTPINGKRLYLPHGTLPEQGHALRGEGWITIAGLQAEADPAAEAKRLGCSHILRDGAAAALAGDS